MASTRFFLETRGKGIRKITSGLLKVAIAHRHKTAYINTDAKLEPNEWDAKRCKVINHPDAIMLNAYITKVKLHVENLLLQLANENRLQEMTASEIKAFIEVQMNPEKEEAERKKNTFATRFLSFAESKGASTKRLYMVTYKRMKDFEPRLESLAFEDITREWLTAFNTFMATTAPSQNARNIHMRNIRAVFNEAIDDEITTAYPFRRFKIRNTATRKRNLKVEDLRTLFNCPCDKKAQKHLDMFKLIFMLIGINLVDLCNLKEIDNEGRVNYYRAKTKRLYSIKVEPEAQEIIEKYKGENWLVDILDRYKDYKDYTKRINQALKLIGPYKREGRGGKKTVEPLFPELSTYWARHSWATIAASLDIPKDTIAHALGHGNNTVTDIYIEFDQSKVDVANRKVLDWVLYGKR